MKVKEQRKKSFGMGSNVKLVSPSCDLISERKKKWGEIFLSLKLPYLGGLRGGLAKDHKKIRIYFRHPVNLVMLVSQNVLSQAEDRKGRELCLAVNINKGETKRKAN